MPSRCDEGAMSDSGDKNRAKEGCAMLGLMKVKATKVKIEFEEAASEGDCDQPRVGEPTKSRDFSVCLMQCE